VKPEIRIIDDKVIADIRLELSHHDDESLLKAIKTAKDVIDFAYPEEDKEIEGKV